MIDSVFNINCQQKLFSESFRWVRVYTGSVLSGRAKLCRSQGIWGIQGIPRSDHTSYSGEVISTGGERHPRLFKNMSPLRVVDGSKVGVVVDLDRDPDLLVDRVPNHL